MAKLTSLRGRCLFCKKLTPEMVNLPDGVLPEGWTLIPDSSNLPVFRLCCPVCKVKPVIDALKPGFKYGVPF